MIAKLRAFWARLVAEITMTPTERYLSRSVDLADLEHRLRTLHQKPTTLPFPYGPLRAPF